MNSLPNKVSEARVDRIMAESAWYDEKFDAHTTLVKCTMPNGWTIIETSSCIDPNEYDHEIGVGICKKRIKDEIWKLEAYLLMCQRHDLEALCAAMDEEGVRGKTEWSIKKVFVKVLDGDDLGWRFYADCGGVRSPYFETYDEACAWMADYDGEGL